MSSREDNPEPGTLAANTSQAVLAALQDNSRESAACPECWHISTTCSSSCRHCFCQMCLWDWSLGEAECPRCRRPIRHPYPQHVALYHEVQDRVYDRKRRWRGHSVRQPRSCSRHVGSRERRRWSSMRWPRDGRRQSWHDRGSESPERRWQQRAWEDAPGEGRAPRFEWDVPGSSWASESRQSWSQRERSQGHRRWSGGRERSHRRNRRRGGSSWRHRDSWTGSHARQRRWRSWNADGRHAPRHQRDDPSERSERHRWEDWCSSGQQHARSRRTRGRSHRRGHNSQETVPHDLSTRQRRRRSCNADRHAPRSLRNRPSGRSKRHRWEDWDSSRQEHVRRSRTWGRSYRGGQDTQTSSEETVPQHCSRRHRRWRSWNADQGRAPRSQRDSPGSPGRSQHRCRSRSRTGHRDM